MHGLWLPPWNRYFRRLPPAREPGAALRNSANATAVLGILGILGAMVEVLLAVVAGEREICAE